MHHRLRSRQRLLEQVIAGWSGLPSVRFLRRHRQVLPKMIGVLDCPPIRVVRSVDRASLLAMRWRIERETGRVRWTFPDQTWQVRCHLQSGCCPIVSKLMTVFGWRRLCRPAWPGAAGSGWTRGFARHRIRSAVPCQFPDALPRRLRDALFGQFVSPAGNQPSTHPVRRRLPCSRCGWSKSIERWGQCWTRGQAIRFRPSMPNRMCSLARHCGWSATLMTCRATGWPTGFASAAIQRRPMPTRFVAGHRSMCWKVRCWFQNVD